jgi:hypothetical protein
MLHFVKDNQMNLLKTYWVLAAIAMWLMQTEAHAAWTTQNVTKAANATGTVHSLTSYTVSGTRHIVYTDTDHYCLVGLQFPQCAHVVELYNNGQNQDWDQRDLTMSAAASRAAANSALTSWTSGTSEHVVYVDIYQHVVELYNNGFAPQWSLRDLSASAGAPVADDPGDLSSFTAGNSQHVIYISGKEVIELFNDGFDPDWHLHRLSFESGAPAALKGSLTSYVDGGSQHVIYIASSGNGSNGHVIELSNNGSDWNWNVHDLTTSSGGWNASSSFGQGLASFTVGTSQHIIYRGCLSPALCPLGGKVVHELFNSGSETNWHDRNLGVPFDSPVTAFYYNKQIRLVGVGTAAADKSVKEYSFPALGPWSSVDVTQAAGSPAARDYGGVVTVYILNGIQHIAYVDFTGDIRDLSN